MRISPIQARDTGLRSLSTVAVALLLAAAAGCTGERAAICAELDRNRGWASIAASVIERCEDVDLETLRRARDAQRAPRPAGKSDVPAWCWCYLGLTDGSGGCLLGKAGAVIPLPVCLNPGSDSSGGSWSGSSNEQLAPSQPPSTQCQADADCGDPSRPFCRPPRVGAPVRSRHHPGRCPTEPKSGTILGSELVHGRLSTRIRIRGRAR